MNDWGFEVIVPSIMTMSLNIEIMRVGCLVGY